MLRCGRCTDFVYLGVVVAFGYCLYSGRFPGLGVVVGLLLGAAAMLAAYDGTMRARREYASTHDGRVTPGVVLARIDPTKATEPRIRCAGADECGATWKR